MGVAASGATLEIQLVADVARLKRDMADMQAAVKSATGGVQNSLGGVGKTSAQMAAQLAAAAQVSARAAVGTAAGMKTVGAASGLAAYQAQNLAFQLNDVVTGLASGQKPLRVLAQQGGQFVQIMQQSGVGVRGFARALLEMVGVLKVTRNSELEAAAATSASAAAALKSVADRAAATVVAKQTQVALLQAELAGAETAELQAAAETKLVAALRAVQVAAERAAIANKALAGAQAEAAGAAQTAAAASRTMLAPLGVALGLVSTVALVAYGAIKQFQSQVNQSGELDRYRASLGLTHKEMLQLSDGVDKVSGKIKGLGHVSLTTGDVLAGLGKTLEDQISQSSFFSGTGAGTWSNFKKNAVDSFNQIVKAWGVVAAGITAGIYGTFNAVKVIWGNFPAVFGDLFVHGVNAAITALNALVKKGVDLLNGFIDEANKLPLVNVGHVTAPQIAEMTNQWKGAASKAASAIGDGYAKAYAAARKSDSSFWAQVGENAKQHAKDRMKAEADALIANRTPKKPHKQSDHGLAEALAELDAQIKGQEKLAEAYQVSDAAAMKAEAMQKAEEQAIRHKGEVGVFYEKLLALAVATRTAEGAKVVADLRFEAAARQRVNDQVEAGLIPASQAGKALELEQKLRPLIAAAAVAEGAAKQKVLDVIASLTIEQGNLNEEIARESALREIAANSDNTERLQKEVELVGASNRARAVELAILEAQQKIRNEQTPLSEQQALIDSYVAQANATVDLAEKQNAYNNSLSYAADLLSLINERAQLASQTLSDAFGSVGAGIGQAITALTNYAAIQAKADQDHEAAIKAAGSNAAELARQEALYATKSANAQMQAIGGVIGGLKGLFKEHSAAYKAMDAVEKAFAIAQLARTIASIAPKIAAGAATMFSQLGVFAFPVVAAMIALMASLGFGGGGNSTPLTSPEDLQKAAGAGTVLGDPTAKSNSVANALDLMAKNSTKGLDYSSDMARSLRKIESSIGNLTAAVARTLQLSGGPFDTSGLDLGTNTKQGFSFLGAALGGILGGILGGKKTVTKSVYDQGFQFDPATIQQIMAQGISGATYQVIETVTKKSGALFGLIGGGTKTDYDTLTGALPDDVSRQFQLIIGQLRDSVVSAAKVLGLDVADALNAFQVEIGKISFKDLTGDEIQKQLEAVFSKLGDQMAGFAVAGLDQFQKAGEGLFETLMRLAKDYLTIDAALKSIGMTFGSVGTASIAARESLIDLAGGLDAFVDQVNFFYDHFLTDAQKAAFAQSQVNAAFAAMGVAVPSSISAFTQLVQGLDLSTDAGQAMFEQLMQIAPAFYEAATAAAQLAQKQQELQVQLLQAQGNTAAATALQRQMQIDALAAAGADQSLIDLQKQVFAAQDAAAKAAAAQDLANKKTQIQIQLLQAEGKATEALALQRKQELAALDPALRALQQQVYQAQDIATAKDNLTAAYQRESQALQDTADKFRKFATDLRAFRDSLFTETTGPTSYNQALVNLMKQSGLATGGDENALGGGLQDAAKTFLDIATANAASAADVARARALVARQLDQAIGGAEGQASLAQQQLDSMHDQVSALVDIDTHVLSVAEAIQQLNALLAPAPPPASGSSGGGHHERTPREHQLTDRLRERMADRLDSIQERMDRMATSMNSLDRRTRDWDRGGSMAVATDDDTPLRTTAS